MQKALTKSSPTVSTLVRKLFNCYNYFLRLSKFLDLFSKVFPMNLKFSWLDFLAYLREQCKQKCFWSYINWCQENSHLENSHQLNSPPSEFVPENSHSENSHLEYSNPYFQILPPGFFKFLFFHYCHRYHWYYLKDCFVIPCFKSAEVRIVAVTQKNL